MIPLAPGQTPRAWQLSATAAARAAFRQGMQAVIVSAATGTGKGTVLAAWARLASERGGRVLVLVHREELVLDLTARIQAIAGKGSVGVCWASRNEILADIVVASVPGESLRRGDELYQTQLSVVASIDRAGRHARRWQVHRRQATGAAARLALLRQRCGHRVAPWRVDPRHESPPSPP